MRKESAVAKQPALRAGGGSKHHNIQIQSLFGSPTNAVVATELGRQTEHNRAVLRLLDCIQSPQIGVAGTHNNSPPGGFIMLTLRQSPFDLRERLEQQVAQAERVPAAEVLEDANGYTVRLELPGVDRGSIDVKATDRTLVISAERRPTPTSDASDTSGDTNAVDATPAQQLFEFRPGTWSRSFACS